LPFSRRGDNADSLNEVKLLSQDKIRTGNRLAKNILPNINTIDLSKITQKILEDKQPEVAAFGNFLSCIFEAGVPEAVSDLLPVACKILKAQMRHNVQSLLFSPELAMSLIGRHSDLTQTAPVLISRYYSNGVVNGLSSIGLQFSPHERVIRQDGPIRMIYLVGEDVSDQSSITNGLLGQFARHDADKFDARFILNFKVNLFELHSNRCLKVLEEAGRVVVIENNHDLLSYIRNLEVDILVGLSDGQYDEVFSTRLALLNLVISGNRKFKFFDSKLFDYTVGSKFTNSPPFFGSQAKHMTVGFGLTFPNDVKDPYFDDHANWDRQHFKFRPGAFLFCYPSSLEHVTKNAFFLWLELLTRVEGSDLVLIRKPYAMYHEVKH
jgi:hypothetical protein